jgi:hypothetical protein
VVYEIGCAAIGLFEPIELFDEFPVVGAVGVPAWIVGESAVKQIQSAKILDREMRRRERAQFRRTEKVP